MLDEKQLVGSEFLMMTTNQIMQDSAPIISLLGRGLAFHLKASAKKTKTLGLSLGKNTFLKCYTNV